MPFSATDFPGVFIFEPLVFTDNRGYFFESYNSELFQREGHSFEWLQDNQAFSTYGVVRGLHYQLIPYAQTKLIRVLSGSILDVIVDLRRNSPTFGKHFSIILDATDKKQLLIPKGFAHGYSVLSASAEVLYKCDNLYNKENEAGINPLCKELNIDWRIPLTDMVLSDKDRNAAGFSDAKNNFV